MDYMTMPGYHWGVFYRAYRDWYKGEKCIQEIWNAPTI